MKHSGWRKPTPGLGIAEQLAQAGEQIATPKTRAFLAVKRVAAHIGLKAAQMLLLDTLAAFTQAQDWDEGRRPIVWASNAYLMERTGFSLSAIKRHARRLAEIGVLSFQDSPNGKRWGRRDANGHIIEAYGFDLSPLSARVTEFEELHANLQAERSLRQRLKRQITVARRMIRARIDAAVGNTLAGPWKQLMGSFHELLGGLPNCRGASAQLAQQLAKLKALQDRVDAAYRRANESFQTVENTSENPTQNATNTHKLNPKEAIPEPHILSTNDPQSVNCNGIEAKQNASAINSLAPEDTADKELNKWVHTVRKTRAALDPAIVMQACPEFASWAQHLGGFLNDWGNLHRIAGQLRPMIGMSEHAWNVAQIKLGTQGATAALALIFEKHCAGEVASPGGYLRGMVDKAGAGELHLERSFYGRLNRRAA
jgi:replication initiation protein RepC